MCVVAKAGSKDWFIFLPFHEDLNMIKKQSPQLPYWPHYNVYVSEKQRDMKSTLCWIKYDTQVFQCIQVLHLKMYKHTEYYSIGIPLKTCAVYFVIWIYCANQNSYRTFPAFSFYYVADRGSLLDCRWRLYCLLSFTHMVTGDVFS